MNRKILIGCLALSLALTARSPARADTFPELQQTAPPAQAGGTPSRTEPTRPPEGVSDSRLTLQEALDTAFQRNPVLRAHRAEVAEADARLRAARIYSSNPTLQGEASTPDEPEKIATELTLSLTQEIELGGKRGARIGAAQRELEAARARLLRKERLLASEVSLIFVDALRDRELLEVARLDAELAGLLRDATQKRFEAGEIAQLSVNIGIAEVGRAEHRVLLAQGAYDEARAVLAGILGLNPAQPPEVAGALTDFAPAPAPLAELMQTLEAHRADLEALRGLREAARARLKLARREAIPNLIVGGFVSRGAPDYYYGGGGAGIELPIFNRNQGGIAEARARIDRTNAELEVLRLEAQQEVATAYARYQAAIAAASRLQETVVGALEESLTLLRKSFEAGKANWIDVVVIRRALIEARRELIDAAAMARRDRVTLDLAAGRLPVPGNTNGEQYR